MEITGMEITGILQEKQKMLELAKNMVYNLIN